MPQWITQILITLVPALLLAVVTSWVTVRLSLRRFHAERWWERKAEAYSRIVEALHSVVEYCAAMSKQDKHVDDAPTVERRKELSDSLDSADRDLRKATGIGAYIISDEVALILSRLDSRPAPNWETSLPYEVFDDDLAAYREALDQVRRLAKKDLKVS